jgi:hypothetical protein
MLSCAVVSVSHSTDHDASSTNYADHLDHLSSESTWGCESRSNTTRAKCIPSSTNDHEPSCEFKIADPKPQSPSVGQPTVQSQVAHGTTIEQPSLQHYSIARPLAGLSIRQQESFEE